MEGPNNSVFKVDGFTPLAPPLCEKQILSLCEKQILAKVAHIFDDNLDRFQKQ